MPSDSNVMHKFSPNTGVFAGYAGLAVAVFVLVTIALQMRNVQGLQVALGVLLGAGAVWVVILRPRAHVTRSTLVLRNMVSDTHIPLASVEKVLMRQTLNVWAHGKRHVCLGIGKSRRQLTGRTRRPSVFQLGSSRAEGMFQGGQQKEKVVYEDFVIDRIRQLADDARRDGLQAGETTRVIALPEVVGLCALAVAFALSFLL